MGGGGADAPDVKGAARVEAAAKKEAAMRELYANRPNQYGPISSTEWIQGLQKDPSSGEWVTSWDQNTTLSDDYQQWTDRLRNQSMDESAYKSGVAQDWAKNGVWDPRSMGDLNNTVSAGDWRQFGRTDPTTAADGYGQTGFATPNMSADDWKQFGQAEQTVGSGTFDERFGNAGDHGFGDHNMSGGDWNMVDYQPEYIRQQAQNMMYEYDKSRLDPEFKKGRSDLEIRLTNQGLQPGDQAYDAAVQSFTNNKNKAYEDARLQSMDASRAEAAMLWDQQMGASEQKNRYTQQDIDNEYRARQANIENYLGGRRDDMQGYLDYSQAAYGQDFQNRQQQIDAQHRYGQEAYQQDLSSKQQELQAQLDFQRQNYEQDFQQRQADIANQLRYGEQDYQQQLSSRDQMMRAMYEREMAEQGRYQAMNPEGIMGAVTDVVGGQG